MFQDNGNHDTDLFSPDHLPPVDAVNPVYLFVKNHQLACSLCSEPGEKYDCFWGEGDYRSLVRNGYLKKPGSELFLGCFNNRPCWVVTLADNGCDQQLDCDWKSLRQCLGCYPDGVFNVLGRGAQLINWFHSHRFCGRCGSATEKTDNECATRCTRCNDTFFPRLSPCAIVLITRGDYCLLARNAAWDRDHFSPVAGFIEAGETAEDTVRREAFEEVGVRVKEVRYFASQPWPFPGQLMLGFFAEYGSGDITPDGVEIVEANWYRYDNLPRAFYAGTLSGRMVSEFARQRRVLNDNP